MRVHATAIIFTPASLFKVICSYFWFSKARTLCRGLWTKTADEAELLRRRGQRQRDLPTPEPSANPAPHYTHWFNWWPRQRVGKGERGLLMCWWHHLPETGTRSKQLWFAAAEEQKSTGSKTRARPVSSVTQRRVSWGQVCLAEKSWERETKNQVWGETFLKDFKTIHIQTTAEC